MLDSLIVIFVSIFYAFGYVELSQVFKKKDLEKTDLPTNLDTGVQNLF